MPKIYKYSKWGLTPFVYPLFLPQIYESPTTIPNLSSFFCELLLLKEETLMSSLKRREMGSLTNCKFPSYTFAPVYWELEGACEAWISKKKGHAGEHSISTACPFLYL